jgi:hypothetical protein
MNDLRTISMPRELQWLYEHVTDEENRQLDGDWTSVTELFKKFKVFNADSRYPTNAVTFGIKMRKFNLPESCLERKRKNDGQYMKIWFQPCIKWFAAQGYHEDITVEEIIPIEDTTTPPPTTPSNSNNLFSEFCKQNPIRM